MSIRPLAMPGSLLKGERAPKGKKSLKVIKGREHDGAHLAAVRKCPCLSCDADPAGEAAHLRASGSGKPLVGMGTKPDDRWTLPLCAACHREGPGAQHRVGEQNFWTGLGLDPMAICARLNAASPNVGAMRAVIYSEKEKRK